MGAIASKIFCDTQRACPSLLWSTTGRPLMTGSLSISSCITRGLVDEFAWIKNRAHGGRPLLRRPFSMVPPPTLDKVGNVVIDRRVSLDAVGNVFHSLCRIVANVRRECSGLFMTQAKWPHLVRSGHSPWGSASGRHTPGHAHANLWDGI